MALEGRAQFVLAQCGDRQGDARCLRVPRRCKEPVHRCGQLPDLGIWVLLLRVGDAKPDARATPGLRLTWNYSTAPSLLLSIAARPGACRRPSRQRGTTARTGGQ